MTRTRPAGIFLFISVLFLCVLRLGGETVTVLSPLDYQVFQRQTRDIGAILVRGHASIGADNVRVCLKGKSISGPLSGKWRALSFNPSNGEFSASVEVAAGGFYTVEVQSRRGHHLVGSFTVPHVGVGEVFLISGQSNSTNYGEALQTTQTAMVTTFGGDSWRIANDPQPGTQDDSKKGSFVPSFGDALYRKYHVPIGIASVGHGSTSVRQWLPAGEPVKVMPTMTKYVNRGPDGILMSDGTLFNGMMRRIQQFGPHGFRAVLWHQGESDSHQPAEHEISPSEYGSMLEYVIVSARKEAGWEMPWFVAQVSYHNPEDPLNPGLRDAQRSLWKSGIATEGPDTDTLTAAYRQNNGKGTHFNDLGLKAHGLLWAKTVESWLDGAVQ
jgi:hypothetical protein